jgi:hypothetical protein
MEPEEEDEEMVDWQQEQSDESNDEMQNIVSQKDDVHGEVGILEEIVLQNFMCHRHLQLKFGPNINFIVGQNGSEYIQTLYPKFYNFANFRWQKCRPSCYCNWIRSKSRLYQ